jgi:signal transduction histidine kinase
VFDLGGLFQNLAGSRTLRAHEDVAIRIRADAHADDVIALCDRDRVEQLIENVVGNALRHTPPRGTMTLSASQAEGLPRCRLATRASVFPEYLPHVFERFYKADSARAAQSTGIAGTVDHPSRAPLRSLYHSF